MVAPTVGALLAGMFNYPEYLGTHLALTFGRLRPVHVNGVIMGAFSSLFIGGMLLPGAAPVRRGAFNRWGVVFAWVWNVFLAAGLTAAPLGYNHGLEAGELPLLAEIPIFFCTVVVTLQFLTTIGRRLDPALYVALWYVMAGSSLLVVLNSLRLERLPGPSYPSALQYLRPRDRRPSYSPQSKPNDQGRRVKFPTPGETAPASGVRYTLSTATEVTPGR